MSPLVQACIVIVTIAVVVLAYFGVRMMFRIEATTKELEAGSRHLEEILNDMRQTSVKVRTLLDVLEQIAHTVRSGVERIEGVVDRATSVSETVLDEIERPVRGVVGVIRGIRSGVRSLTERWTNGRGPRIHTSEGESHV
jgi:uncharacterized protein YoxC